MPVIKELQVDPIRDVYNFSICLNKNNFIPSIHVDDTITYNELFTLPLIIKSKILLAKISNDECFANTVIRVIYDEFLKTNSVEVSIKKKYKFVETKLNEFIFYKSSKSRPSSIKDRIYYVILSLDKIRK